MSNIAILLSRQFMNWLAISIVIGSSLSWYLMRLWLENFAYQTQMDSWIFILSAVSVVIIAMIAVSWRVYQSASRNPVETLGNE